MDIISFLGYTGILALSQQLKRCAVESDYDFDWAFVYGRYSSAPQEEGDTVRRQDSLAESWLKRNPRVKLDTSLKAWDKGAVSGFTAAHRTNPKYVLAQFLNHVNGKRVRPGSYLLVENIDRLTREHWKDSLPFILSLIEKGIRIVQLSPVEVIYSADMDQTTLLLMLLELGRSHGESKMKSERVGAAWRAKKEAARNGVPFGQQVPAWLELVNGSYRLRPLAARSIHKIFSLARRGHGSLRIRKELVSSSEAPFAGEDWSKSYIAKILRSRSVIGEYQPMRTENGKRVPDGEPIPNYYPAVISEAEFHAAQSAQDARVNRGGRPSQGGKLTSPFVGLLHCANDGAKLYVGQKRHRYLLMSSAYMKGDEKACILSFPLDHFADAVLKRLRELSAGTLFNDSGAGLVDELKGRLRDVEDKLAVAVVRFDANPNSRAWADRIDVYEAAQQSLAEELRHAQQAAANPVSATWIEAVELMRQDEPARLRQCLLETIAEVWVLLVGRGRGEKLAAVQVWFVGGGRREYLILSRAPTGVAARKSSGTWVAYQLSEKVSGQFDLRDKKHVAKLTRLLEAIDLTTF